jgi:hypothetical protein
MSVRAFWRVQCSGECGAYLIVHRSGDNRTYSTVSYADHATEFDTWATADEAAAKAGWHDGNMGQYAPCTCERRSVTDYKGRHPVSCRRMLPRLVPLCPRCRAQKGSGS